MRARVFVDHTVHFGGFCGGDDFGLVGGRNGNIARANGAIRPAFRSEFVRARVLVDHAIHVGGFQGGDFGLVGGGNIEGIGVDGGGDLEELEAGF